MPADALGEGFISAGWIEGESFAAEQKRFVGRVWRLLGKLLSNRVQQLRYENGRLVEVTPMVERFWCWAGADTLRWAAERPERLLLLEMGWSWENPNGPGMLVLAYRPLDAPVAEYLPALSEDAMVEV